jgi:uncharacterized protein
MNSMSRRLFLQGAGGLALATAGLGSYAVVFEPVRLNVTSYRITPPRWPDGLTVKAAILADIHACEPWMPASRVRGIANLANDLAPDIIFLLGDFSGGHRFVTGPVMPEEWGEALSILKAPLGVYAVLGNHDWWHGPLPSLPADGAEGVRQALRSAGIEVLENESLRVSRRFGVREGAIQAGPENESARRGGSAGASGQVRGLKCGQSPTGAFEL